MSEKKSDKSPALKRSWFQNLKSEFSKITWPTKDRLCREVVVVLSVAILIGLLIVGVDFVLQHLFVKLLILLVEPLKLIYFVINKLE